MLDLEEREDTSVIEVLQNPDYYAGIYDVGLVFVTVKDEVQYVSAPARIGEANKIEARRRYTVPATQLRNGEDAVVEIEYHHKRQGEVTNILISPEKPTDTATVAGRWGVQQFPGGFDA